MLIDLAINPFDADVASMVEFASGAEAIGVDGIWVADHFSGAVVDRAWSRDPFVCLGAIAATTYRVRVGALVANMRNRHVLQLATAVNSLQSLAPGRVVCGVGSGAVPSSRFAVEHEMIGTELGDSTGRRRGLVDTIVGLREIWDGVSSRRADGVAPTGYGDAAAIVDGAPIPPIVVGASAWPTIDGVMSVADGVNLRNTAALDSVLRRLSAVRPDAFEISVLTAFDDDLEASTLAQWRSLGVDRIVLGVSPPHATHRLDRVASIRSIVG